MVLIISQLKKRGVLLNKFDNLVTINEVAERFRVSGATIRKLVIKGDITGYKIGGQWRIDINSCEDYVNNRMAVNINKNKERIGNYEHEQ